MRKQLILSVLGLTMAGGMAAAQTPPGGQGGPGGPGGGPPDFAAMRQMMMDRMKEALGVNDEEWKALEPRIEKVQQLQRDSRGGGGMFMMFGRGPGAGGPGGPGRGPGGPGGPGFGAGGDRAPSPVMQATMDLRDTLDNKDAKPADIQSKLKALRDARAKAHDDLAKAQDDLKSLLTTRQEAVLVTMGMLE